MKFIRLHDPLLGYLFEDDDIVAIDKPYGFNAHTNDSKIEHSDFIQDGLIEIYEKNFDKKLHIIHRLDQTTTGVMIFGKSTESAKKYAEFFFNRQVKKTYYFITKAKTEQKQFTIDKIIIHKGKELEAKTNLSFVKTDGKFSLWKANPLTGRNHQIRIHAEHAGISILGDEKYNGARFPFLCLHNQRIEFPNGILIESKAPTYFENLSLLQDELSTSLHFEADRRKRLFPELSKPDTSAHFDEKSVRLVHNLNQSQRPGFTADLTDISLVVSWFRPSLSDLEKSKLETFAAAINRELIVTEVKKEIPIAFPTNHRLHRNWIEKNASDKSVLSLFSQNGDFSLAAARGFASSVVSVELSKSQLNHTKQQFLKYQIDESRSKFLCRDSYSFIEQCKARGTKFDLIICEAPTFYRREKGVFRIEKDLEGLLGSSLACLNPKGVLLLSTTTQDMFIDDLRRLIERQQNLGFNFELSCILPSMDFETPEQRANLKSFFIRRL